MKRSSIVLNGITIQYQIRRSRKARNVNLSIKYDGGLTVTVPRRCSLNNVEEILVRHRRWILNRITENFNSKKKPPFQLEDGKKLPLLNQTYQLSLKKGSENRIYWQCIDHKLEIFTPEFSFQWVYLGVEAWYREMAKSFLYDRVPFWVDQMNVRYPQIRVKNQRTLWGSCSKKGNVNFNWRIMLLTPKEADYLIVHELAHFKEMNHSPRFWKIVERHCPDYHQIKRQVKNKNHLLQFPVEV